MVPTDLRTSMPTLWCCRFSATASAAAAVLEGSRRECRGRHPDSGQDPAVCLQGYITLEGSNIEGGLLGGSPGSRPGYRTEPTNQLLEVSLNWGPRVLCVVESRTVGTISVA